MISNDKLNAILSYYKNLMFSCEQIDIAIRVESIVHAISRYFKDNDKDCLLRYLSDYCPVGDYGFESYDEVDAYCLKHDGRSSYCESCWEMVIGDKQ